MSSSGPNQYFKMMSSTASLDVEAVQCRRGVRASKSTSSANRERSRPESLATARAKCSPTVVVISCPLSVAESGRRLIADPLPHRNRATYGGVADQRRLVELLGVETDRAHQVRATRCFEPLGQLGQPRAAFARGANSDTLHRQPDSLLGEKHQRRPSLFGCADRHEEGNGDLLRILQPSRQADHCLALHLLPSLVRLPDACLHSCRAGLAEHEASAPSLQHGPGLGGALLRPLAGGSLLRWWLHTHREQVKDGRAGRRSLRRCHWRSTSDLSLIHISEPTRP